LCAFQPSACLALTHAPYNRSSESRARGGPTSEVSSDDPAGEAPPRIVRTIKRTRRAVGAAASRLYEKNPLLRRNASKTATQIASIKLEALRKRDGTFLGTDAIIKHLRALRRTTQSAQEVLA